MRYTCSQCRSWCDGRTDKNGRQSRPRKGGQWKELNGQIWCGKCVKHHWSIRAIEFPVLRPLDATWQEFDQLARSCLVEAVALCRWGVGELRKADGVRTAAMKSVAELPEFNVPYLYGLFKSYHGRIAWEGATCQANVVLQRAIKLYLQHRKAALWEGKRIPEPRSVPYPLEPEQWEVGYGRDNIALVKVKILGRTFCLHLKSGQAFGRQLAGFRSLVDGQAIPAEAAILERNGDIWVKLVGRFPRKNEASNGKHTLVLATDPQVFWTADIAGRRVWLYTHDDIKRLIVRHKEYLAATANDRKAEVRATGRRNRRLHAAVAERCKKQRARLKGFIDFSVAQVVGLCLRRAVGEVLYDARDKGYLPSFPWSMLTRRLQESLGNHGIAFRTTTGE